MMKLFFMLVLAALINLTFVQGYGRNIARGESTYQSKKAVSHYVCPMHPEVTSDRKGNCPKCGMALRLVKNSVSRSASKKRAAAKNSSTGPQTTNASLISAPRIPDVIVYNQNGRKLNFYTDLVKGKTVAINFIFTTCTTICPPLTATFRRVQQELGEHMGREIELISISVDPTIDTPERLFDFASKFKAGPGWTFVTGDSNQIDTLLKALGAAVGNKNDHTPTILVGNEASGYWTRAYGLSSPATLVKVITEAADHK